MIDACAHPMFPRANDLNAYLPREYQTLRLAMPLQGVYPLPIDTYMPGSTPTVDYRPPRPGRATSPYHPHVGTTGEANACLPGSDPGLMDTHVLTDPGADFAVLLPLTRGIVGDIRLEVAIAAAINEWLAETWLDEHNAHGHYRGSIRVCPRSPSDAVREIERWAGHPRFVQIAVPLESTHLYGEQFFFPVWKEAAESGLPVVLHGDHSTGALPPPTPLGYPMFTLEAVSQEPMLAVTHLASLIGHGVLDRLDSLVFVFADGGFDYMTTLMWRVDNDWRQSRAEVPWVASAPSDYLAKHFRFVVQSTDGIDDPAQFGRFVDLNSLDQLLLYGSNYPYWDHLPAAELATRLSDTARDAVMDGNARLLYGLPAEAGSQAA